MIVQEAFDALTPEAQKAIYILLGACFSQIEHVVHSVAMSDAMKVSIIDGLLTRTRDAVRGEWCL